MAYKDPEKKRKWTAENLHRKAEYYRRYRERNPGATEKARRKHQIKQFGLTLEEYDAMWFAQGGCCAICRTKRRQELSVDHNHDTGRVRGLLCNKCNSMLGMANDTKELLLAGVAYLEKDEDPTGASADAGGDW